MEVFRVEKEISTTDIIDFYLKIEPSLKRSTIDWRIYDLTRRKILHRVSRGRYSLTEVKKQNFHPKIELYSKRLYSNIKNQLPYIDFIVWQTKWLNEFMVHQPGRFATIIEVEKGVKEAVFKILLKNKKDVFMSPTQDIIDIYLYNSKNPIVVKNLISEAPIQKVNNIGTTTIEKLLVDIISDSNLFGAFQGSEMKNIYQMAFTRYNISISKMKRYANRRSKSKKLDSMLMKTKLRQ